MLKRSQNAGAAVWSAVSRIFSGAGSTVDSGRALYEGRLAPSVDDVKALAEPVLQHRMALNFAARADGMHIRDVIANLVKAAV